MTATLTKRQRELARHALGLPNRNRVSYRNRYACHCSPGGDTDEWFAMAEQGVAEFSFPFRDTVRFWLTPEGAMAALDEGETLDPEDFPK